MKNKSDFMVWAMFYSGIVSFQYHPRNRVSDRYTLLDCALIADEMLVEFNKRFAEEG